MPLYSRYGTRIRGPSSVSMPTGSSRVTRKRRLSSCQRRLSVICRPGAVLSSASICFSERAVSSASSSTIPWLFLAKTRKTPCGVRSAVHTSPSSVLTMRKFVSVSVGELNALDAFCSATSRGTSRTLPPGGSPSISSYVVLLTIARSTSGPLSDAPMMNTRNAATGNADQPLRRAHPAAQVLERRPVALRAAQQHGRRGSAAPAARATRTGWSRRTARSRARSAGRATARRARQSRGRRSPGSRV